MRKQIQRLSALGVFVILIQSLIATVACTGSGGSLTAPGGTASTGAPGSSTTPAATGATISGTVAGLTAAASTDWRAFNNSGVTVTVTGTTVSTSVDGNGTFTLTGVPPIDVVLAFTGPGVNATLSLGTVADSDHLEITVTVGSTTATLDAQQKTSADQKVEAEGIVDNLDASARTFTINGAVIQVPTSAVVRRGDASIGFGELKRGDRVHVKGVKDGSIVRASEVIAQNTAPPPVTTAPPPPATTAVSFTGRIVGVRGTCPALTMKVGDTYVETNGSTTFSGKGCADFKTGDAVGVFGQSNGSIVTATKLVGSK